MIYIHALKDLNPKSVDIESTQIVRQIKQKSSFPLSEERVNKEFSQFFVSRECLDCMRKSLETVPSAVDNILELTKTNGLYEPINLQRACSDINEMPDALKKNIEYFNDIFKMQGKIISDITKLLNKIPYLKTIDEKKAHNSQISSIFEKILRNNQNIFYNFNGIVNEAHTARMNSLMESMNNGFFFSVRIEEHLQKLNFDKISERIPAEELERTRKIKEKIAEIKQGVDNAYASNMNLVNFAVVLYSYIKWIKDIKL